MIHTTARCTASRKILATWTMSMDVGIWADCPFTIRLYPDRAVYKGSRLRWSNNTASFAKFSCRLPERAHSLLLKLQTDEARDDENYASDAFEIAASARMRHGGVNP